MKSQNELILEHLKSGQSITPLEALKKFGSLRLGARIYYLKKQGEKINSRLIETASGKHVAQYWIA